MLGRLILCILIFLAPHVGYAFKWRDLWLKPDQQGAKSLAQGKPEDAAEQFQNPSWKGVAQYRAGQYDAASETLASQNSQLDHYNRGNALAQQGKYQNAIEAYDQALKINPNFADAKYNKELLEKILKDHPEQKKSESSSQSNNDKKTQDTPESQEAESEQRDKKTQNAAQNQSNKQNASDNKPNTQEQSESKAGQQNEDPANAADKKDNPNAKPEQRSDQKADQKANQKPEMTYQQKADQQWLQQIPDNPGSLLKQKFLRDHQMRAQQNSGEQSE